MISIPLFCYPFSNNNPCIDGLYSMHGFPFRVEPCSHPSHGETNQRILDAVENHALLRLNCIQEGASFSFFSSLFFLLEIVDKKKRVPFVSIRAFISPLDVSFIFLKRPPLTLSLSHSIKGSITILITFINC